MEILQHSNQRLSGWVGGVKPGMWEKLGFWVAAGLPQRCMGGHKGRGRGRPAFGTILPPLVTPWRGPQNHVSEGLESMKANARLTQSLTCAEGSEVAALGGGMELKGRRWKLPNPPRPANQLQAVGHHHSQLTPRSSQLPGGHPFSPGQWAGTGGWALSVPCLQAEVSHLPLSTAPHFLEWDPPLSLPFLGQTSRNGLARTLLTRQSVLTSKSTALPYSQSQRPHFSTQAPSPGLYFPTSPLPSPCFLQQLLPSSPPQAGPPKSPAALPSAHSLWGAQDPSQPPDPGPPRLAQPYCL